MQPSQTLWNLMTAEMYREAEAAYDKLKHSDLNALVSRITDVKLELGQAVASFNGANGDTAEALADMRKAITTIGGLGFVLMGMAGKRAAE